MKNNLRIFSFGALLILALSCIVTISFGQAPQYISYQGVIRNTGNALVPLTQVGMQVSILQGSSSGTPVYVETQTPTTDINGLATIMIGSGTIVTGTMAGIDWTAGPYFVKTETDPTGGINYTISSVGQMLSVPYSLYSALSGSSTPGPAGNGISSTVDNGNGTFTLNYTDGSYFTTSDFTGPQGIPGNDGSIGPVGPEGPQGPQGPPGVLSVNCLECHNHQDGTGTASGNLASKKLEYEFSKHGEGKELSLEEGYSAGCSPCHANEGFHSVVDGSVIPTYTTSTSSPYSGANPKYTFAYSATAAASTNLTTWPGNVGCFTCHSSLPADSMATLDFSAGVNSTMWAWSGQTKTFDIPTNNHESNLCIKCHQPRPMNRGTFSSTVIKLSSNNSTITFNNAVYNGRSIDYVDLASNPANIFYDSAATAAATNIFFPAYRSHNHYGAVAAIFAGTGAVEFSGSAVYTDTSTHRLNATCIMCHMAKPAAYNGEPTGGHTFYAEGNINGCKTCHPSWTSYNNTTINSTKSNHQTALSALAARLKSGGLDIMHKNPDPASNIFAALTPEGYDGYLDIYDPSINPGGQIRNPIYTASGSSAWTAAQISTNAALPPLKSLTNAEWGAIINFQLLLREFSSGIHNPKYSQALFTNTNEALTAVGIP